MTMQDYSDLEAQAFDKQITERIHHGHVPDLRRVTPCHYFFNNPWREPEYVKLDFVEQYELIRDTLHTLFPERESPIRIIEIGCGPGHLCLELARAGFDVTGIDLSPQCISVAERLAAEDPWKAERGPLRYHCINFLSHASTLSGPYAASVFVGALHHFRDQGAVMHNVVGLLESDGCILVHEPTRDRFTEATVSLVHLIRVLLSAGKGFFESEPIPLTQAEQDEAITRLFAKLKYENEHGNKKQSVNDNEAGFADMITVLDAHFDRVILKDRYAFFHEIIGGLRFEHGINVQVAGYLRDMDARLCKLGVITATEFFYAGRRKGNWVVPVISSHASRDGQQSHAEDADRPCR